MKITANVYSRLHQHEISVSTNESAKTISIAPKVGGWGSSINGGELLMLALATCFCNDIYREAAKKNIAVSGVEVRVTGDFGAEGEPGNNFTYTAEVKADAPDSVVRELIEETDKLAEIHNTLRKGIPVTLVS